MSQFTIYGLDENERLLLTEFLDAPDIDCASRIADARLTNFPMVELWQAAMCMIRKTAAPVQP